MKICNNCLINCFDDDIECPICECNIFRHNNGNFVLYGSENHKFFHAVPEAKIFSILLEAQDKGIMSRETNSKLWQMLFEGS